MPSLSLEQHNMQKVCLVVVLVNIPQQHHEGNPDKGLNGSYGKYIIEVSLQVLR